MTTPVTQERLLSCPFCGDDAIAGATLDDAHYVMCRNENCWAMTGYLPTSAEAISAWNRRPTLSTVALPDELEVVAWEGHWPGAGSINSSTRVTRFRSDMEAWESNGGQIEPLVRLSQAHSTIAALRAERNELLYLHSERDQGDKIINERLAALEDGVKAVVTERDSWKAACMEAREGCNQRSDVLASMRKSRDEIVSAIGSVRWMDPPDGGNVSLAEQITRMRADLETAEAEVKRLTEEKEALLAEVLKAQYAQGEEGLEREAAEAERVALRKALKWFMDRRRTIQAKFALHGPKDTADAMVKAFDAARKAMESGE